MKVMQKAHFSHVILLIIKIVQTSVLVFWWFKSTKNVCTVCNTIVFKLVMALHTVLKKKSSLIKWVFHESIAAYKLTAYQVKRLYRPLKTNALNWTSRYLAEMWEPKIPLVPYPRTNVALTLLSGRYDWVVPCVPFDYTIQWLFKMASRRRIPGKPNFLKCIQ